MKISVIIPTLNSEKTIGIAVKSAIDKIGEVIVVDSFSKDKTTEIAKREGAKVIQVKGSRLIARIEGAKSANGNYIINFDSDMYFSEEVKIEPRKEMVALGEITVGKGIVHRLMSMDRKIYYEHWKENFDVLLGGIIPRVYKRELLLGVYEKIPHSLIDKIDIFEDSIIYYEAFKQSYDKETQFIPNAVYHIEDDTLLHFMKKWYGYGKNAKLLKSTEYVKLVYSRKGRKGATLSGRIQLLPVFLVKAIPFALGYYF